MVVYTVWQCLQCRATILMPPHILPGISYWPSPRNIVACCDKPNINRVLDTQFSECREIELPADEETTQQHEATPQQHDRINLVLEDLEAG